MSQNELAAIIRGVLPMTRAQLAAVLGVAPAQIESAVATLLSERSAREYRCRETGNVYVTNSLRRGAA